MIVLCVQLLGNQHLFGRIQEENCGSVSLSLRYDSEQLLLTVRIVRAHELLPREGHSGMDPYCRLRLLPDRRHQLHSKVRTTLTTRVRSAFRKPIVLALSLCGLWRSAFVAGVTLKCLPREKFARYKIIADLMSPPY